MNRLPLLDAELWDRFPDPRQALAEPNGLLAFGGDLSPRRLLAAYSLGIFPWFGEHEPILWWSPDPRCVFHTVDLKVNRSLRRTLARRNWRFTVDHAFHQVIRACADPRAGDSSTWIVPAMIDAYEKLHEQGHAHSVEAWEGSRLVGGIYGVAVGRLFCGESMFSRESNASRATLVALAQVLLSWDFPLIDAQVANPHTLGLGAREISRADFLGQVSSLTKLEGRPGNWASGLELRDV
ncbi:leucyl/phenylalanyl-tRNA--protein transferase [Bordetella sp.]|uniref:leucyl/phenylalanyl-tRNA--protein transferase n=1 Tax=Bordetella sp. TaxID=28081 RepID=UPI0008D6DC20|nr:leucyl/phenylalanyl-tRNA--protein transferase [Rhodanobacter denitrificans]OHC44369.1 MAG: leucyl/phenylalanyl-tRNA--protein transferase [Rhodanobacter sp. RIFOXYA1_FULL_67_6]